MRTHDYLKARLQWARHDFDDVLEKLTEADLPWRPTDDMLTVAGLLIEMANKEKELIGWLQSGEWPDDDPDAFEETATLAEMRSGFRSTSHVCASCCASHSAVGFAVTRAWMISCEQG
jgi:hypothetical protein